MKMVGVPTLCFVLVFVFRVVFSYPYTSFKRDEFESDHAAIVAAVDGQTVSMPYVDDAAAEFAKETAGYDDLYYKSGGGKGDSGYDKYDGYDTGEAGYYGADGHKSRYSDQGGQKSGNKDQSNYYNDKHALVKGLKGANFAISNNFNKGSKTTGFHNVHHKEEYKKNHNFYNEGSKSGNYHRYGDFGAALLAAAGGSANGKKFDEGYKAADYGKKGFTDKGSLYNDLHKYAAANGYDSHHNNQQDYGNIGGASKAQQSGYYH